jgi:hypothetical protein
MVCALTIARGGWATCQSVSRNKVRYLFQNEVLERRPLGRLRGRQTPVPITKSLEDITKGLEKAVAEIANAGAQIGEGFEEAGVDLGKTLDEVNADVVESIEKALNDPNNPLKVSESCIQKIFKI